MDFGFSTKKFGKRLELKFKEEKVACKERKLSELLKDKVILDLENAKKLLKEKGDLTIYQVFNLWKFDIFAKNFLKNFGIMIDLTLLKEGVFSLEKKGEAFCTYGHAHEKKFAEVYVALKNDCYLLLSHKKTFNSYLIKIKEGYSFFIHPSFIHRLVSGKKDCLVMNFVPEKAGHDYDVVRNRGFPFHIFYDEKKNLEFKENKKYPEVGLVIVDNIKKFDVLRLFEKEPRKLKEILSRPTEAYDLMDMNFYFKT